MFRNTGDWPMRYGGDHAFPRDHLRAGDLCTACYPSGFSDDNSYDCHDQGRTRTSTRTLATYPTAPPVTRQRNH